jgi:hypothetical protein
MIYLFSSYNNDYFYEKPYLYRFLDTDNINDNLVYVYKRNPHIDNDDISFIKMKLPSINKRIILEDLYPNKSPFRECVEKRIEEIIFEKI